jgi:Trk K+ transport system NAD-binding subunit
MLYGHQGAFLLNRTRFGRSLADMQVPNEANCTVLTVGQKNLTIPPGGI